MVDQRINRIAQEIVSHSIKSWSGYERVMPRNSHIPTSVKATIYDPKGTDLDIRSYVDPIGKFLVGIVWQGKSQKPLWKYRFNSQNQLDNRIQQTISSRKNSLEEKANRRRKRVEYQHSLKVGTILYSSWGYNQTNVDFYEVVELVGDKSVKIRKIDKTGRSNGVGQNLVKPIPGKFISSAILKRVGFNNSINLSSYAGASVWDGQPKHETAAGYGH